MINSNSNDNTSSSSSKFIAVTKQSVEEIRDIQLKREM